MKKRRICLFLVCSMIIGIWSFVGQCNAPMPVHALAAKLNIPTPLYSSTLNFDNVAEGTYANKTADSNALDTVLNDGGGMKLNLAEGSDSYGVVSVVKDPKGKFNGSKVLAVNPVPTDVTKGQTIARLRPSDSAMEGVFQARDKSSGARTEHGYRLVYSYDFYTTISSGFGAQDVLWTSSSNTSLASETLLNTKTSNLHNPMTALASKETAGTDSAGTINWKGSTWTQTVHPNAIHMEYVFDFETGEIWMYSDGVLFACRDFSEMERSYFKSAYQSLDKGYGVVFQFRQSGDTGTVYYDNFRVDMYGADVTAQQLCERAAEQAQSFQGSAVTVSKTADFENGTGAEGFSMKAGTVTVGETSVAGATYAAENGRLKLQHNTDAGTGDCFLNIQPQYHTYAQLNPRASGLPNPVVGTTSPSTSTSLFTNRLGFDRRGADTSGAPRYDLYGVEYIDYLKFSLDVEMDTANTGSTWLYANWYPFDGQSHSADTMPSGMGVNKTYNPCFIRFDKEPGVSGGSVLAFGTDTGVKWTMGQPYHVDYLVNLQTGQEEAYLDGVLIATNMAGSEITERGNLARVRANFEKKTSSDIMYLDNINYTIYNDLNTTFQGIQEDVAVENEFLEDGFEVPVCTLDFEDEATSVYEATEATVTVETDAVYGKIANLTGGTLKTKADVVTKDFYGTYGRLPNLMKAELDVKLPETADASIIAETADGQCRLVTIQADGTMVFGSTEQGKEVPYIANKWYHVTFYLDFSKGTYRAYLGQIACGEFSLDSSSETLTQLSLDAESSTVYTDNLVLSTLPCYARDTAAQYRIPYIKNGERTAVCVPVKESEQKVLAMIAKYQPEEILEDILSRETVTIPPNRQQTVSLDSSAVQLETSGKYQLFAWDVLQGLAPVSAAYVFEPKEEEPTVTFKYPGYVEKVVTFSYDDWEDGDAKLIAMLDKNGLKGTFNLITSRSGRKIDIPSYDGHEIANHSYQHLKYTVTPENATTDWPYRTLTEVVNDIGQGHEDIVELTGKAPIGFVWPYGRPDARADFNEIMAYLKALGVKYVRPVASTNGFSLPSDWYHWRPTCHHDNMGNNLQKFLNLEEDGTLKCFYVWGHTFELEETYKPEETNKVRWDDMEGYLAQLKDREDIWKATNGEIYTYVEAIRSATVNQYTRTITNPSNVTIYATVGDKQVAIASGATITY